MGYWTVWLGGLIGVLLGITVFRIIVHHFKWPSIVAASIAALVILGCYWGGYYLEYGTRPEFTGLLKVIRGVWGEAKAFFANVRRMLP